MSADHALFGAGLTLPGEADTPRDISGPLSAGDRAFRSVLRAAGISVLLLTGLIAVFLVIRAGEALRIAGFQFLTTKTFNPAAAKFGIATILPNGIIIALIALVIAVPVALGTALFISEYAPDWLKRPMIALTDLMAAIPSILYGLWGVYFLSPHILGTIRWMSDHLSFIPIFVVRGDHSSKTSFGTSTFIAGIVVSLMIVPIVTSISREVFQRAPAGEREAAYALGSSKWGMIRSVVLPYGKGGMIGATMLGLGRAMGETIVVFLILSPTIDVSWHIFENSGNSIAYTIAQKYGESTPLVLSALMAAGLVLFLVTLAINAAASVVVGRSRSGADG